MKECATDYIDIMGRSDNNSRGGRGGRGGRGRGGRGGVGRGKGRGGPHKGKPTSSHQSHRKESLRSIVS